MQRRLFIAIPIPDDICFVLEKATGSFEEHLRGVGKVIPSENWHFTLVFLGDTDDKLVPLVSDSVRAAISRAPKEIDVTIEQLVPSSNDPFPHMFWFLGDGKTFHVLGEIVANIKHELRSRDIAFRNDFENFTAHITCARLYEGKRPRIKLPKIKPQTFPLSEILVIESHLGSRGSHYDILDRVAL